MQNRERLNQYECDNLSSIPDNIELKEFTQIIRENRKSFYFYCMQTVANQQSLYHYIHHFINHIVRNVSNAIAWDFSFIIMFFELRFKRDKLNDSQFSCVKNIYFYFENVLNFVISMHLTSSRKGRNDAIQWNFCSVQDLEYWQKH